MASFNEDDWLRLSIVLSRPSKRSLQPAAYSLQPNKERVARICWLLAVGCWLLAVGCWLSAVGCWLLAVGCWLSAPLPRSSFCHSEPVEELGPRSLTVIYTTIKSKLEQKAGNPGSRRSMTAAGTPLRGGFSAETAQFSLDSAPVNYYKALVVLQR